MLIWYSSLYRIPPASNLFLLHQGQESLLGAGGCWCWQSIGTWIWEFQSVGSNSLPASYLVDAGPSRDRAEIRLKSAKLAPATGHSGNTGESPGIRSHNQSKFKGIQRQRRGRGWSADRTVFVTDLSRVPCERPASGCRTADAWRRDGDSNPR